jgi:sensor domain CHASE-containing protein
MIKFFRNIRKNRLNEGKTSKYFKYAIGEIVVVVIGILIALQINNWNSNQKDELQETKILLQLKEGLALDRNKMEAELNYPMLQALKVFGLTLGYIGMENG